MSVLKRVVVPQRIHDHFLPGFLLLRAELTRQFCGMSMKVNIPRSGAPNHTVKSLIQIIIDVI